MKITSFFLFLFHVFSFSSLAFSGNEEESRKLQEIIILGSYAPENPKELEKAEEFYRFVGGLEEGESFKEKFPHLQAGQERFQYSGRMYCYNRTKEENKDNQVIFDPNMRIYLYDEEGNILVEDYLRDRQLEMDHPFTRTVKSYIPYPKDGGKIHIVRMEGDEKVNLASFKVMTEEELAQPASNYALVHNGNCYHSLSQR